MSGSAEYSNPVEICKKNLTLLQAQRDALELEANSIASGLNSPGVNGEPPVGVKGSLVDSGGFPLAGFDLFNVREKRHRFCCIQTDHKAIMAKIEKALHVLHEIQAPSMSPQPDHTAPGTRMGRPRAGAGVSTRSMVPIARVNQVSEGSPAAAAGLTVGDLVLRFGNVDISHPKGLGGVVDVVREKEGQEVPVVVLRHGGRGGSLGQRTWFWSPKRGKAGGY